MINENNYDCHENQSFIDQQRKQFIPIHIRSSIFHI